MSSVRCPLLGEPLILTPSVLVAPGEFFIYLTFEESRQLMFSGCFLFGNDH